MVASLSITRKCWWSAKSSNIPAFCSDAPDDSAMTETNREKIKFWLPISVVIFSEVFHWYVWVSHKSKFWRLSIVGENWKDSIYLLSGDDLGKKSFFRFSHVLKIIKKLSRTLNDFTDFQHLRATFSSLQNNELSAA